MPNPAQGTVNFAVVVVKSMWWPGAFTFFSQGRWQSIYVGDGLKHEDVTYYPVFPPKIKEDPKERPCQPEPTPLQEEPPKAAEEEGYEDGQ
mmetsp:Transcript_7261/g.5536  ORF Transcript_7261/g.5536 Transcript_7261/m.5536 type:complete len:91 (-) Transcript_7261:33-305(-)